MPTGCVEGCVDEAPPGCVEGDLGGEAEQMVGESFVLDLVDFSEEEFDFEFGDIGGFVGEGEEEEEEGDLAGEGGGRIVGLVGEA